ncbi:WXG100-like domain-containing protein [Saccharothrix deserti]|uniref:WXG100-like domain-containing protein n=1 Tax=Saccharothrix deserti TaxID=2593674 RepID=UPI00131A97F2|nr:hypothetical protein [Saccharothrix deserti]
MPIPEPEGVLWWLVKPLSGWPQTDEEFVGGLADGWRAGGVAMHTAGRFDPGPLAAAWPDDAGQKYGTRLGEHLRWVNQTSADMAGLSRQATRLAEAVTQAKTSIRTLMSAGEQLMFGSVITPLEPALQTQIVLHIAGRVNDILARTASTVGAPPNMPGAPKPPEPDAGAGEFGSDPNALDQQLYELGYNLGTKGTHPFLPDGADHLAHYFDGTGTPMDINPDTLFDAVPGLRDRVDAQLGNAALPHIDQAINNRDYGRPIPFESGWKEFNVGPFDNPNWHLGVGKGDHAVTGVVTVHPPDTPGGAHRVEVTYQSHVFDHYNWTAGDYDKGVKLGPLKVPGTSDGFISEFHRAGVAQEYQTRGSSEVRTETWEVR